jgi:hypothetical protein
MYKPTNRAPKETIILILVCLTMLVVMGILYANCGPTLCLTF